jgi:hypothetical protein
MSGLRMEKRGKKLIEEEQLLVRVHNGTVRTSGRKLFLLLRGRFEDDDQDYGECSAPENYNAI